MAPTPGIWTQKPLYFLSMWAILFHWKSQNICFELTFHSRCFKIRFNATDHRKWIVCILCVLASTAFDVIRPEKNKLILNGSPNQTLEAKQSLQSWTTVHWLRRLDRWTENNHWEVLNYLTVPDICPSFYSSKIWGLEISHNLWQKLLCNKTA